MATSFLIKDYLNFSPLKEANDFISGFDGKTTQDRVTKLGEEMGELFTEWYADDKNSDLIIEEAVDVFLVAFSILHEDCQEEEDNCLEKVFNETEIPLRDLMQPEIPLINIVKTYGILSQSLLSICKKKGCIRLQDVDVFKSAARIIMTDAFKIFLRLSLLNSTEKNIASVVQKKVVKWQEKVRGNQDARPVLQNK